MILKMEKTNTLTLEHDSGMSAKQMESLSGTFRNVNGDTVRGTHFMKFTRTFSRREEETRDAHWIPLEKTLESYHVAIRGTSRVLKGDLLRGCLSC
jgi:hypothetical protein